MVGVLVDVRARIRARLGDLEQWCRKAEAVEKFDHRLGYKLSTGLDPMTAE